MHIQTNNEKKTTTAKHIMCTVCIIISTPYSKFPLAHFACCNYFGFYFLIHSLLLSNLKRD